MYVIRHDHPRVQLVPASLAFSAANRFRHQAGDAWIAQPLWARARTVEGAIRRYESVARGGIGSLYAGLGQRSEEAPGEEDVGVVGLEVG